MNNIKNKFFLDKTQTAEEDSFKNVPPVINNAFGNVIVEEKTNTECKASQSDETQQSEGTHLGDETQQGEETQRFEKFKTSNPRKILAILSGLIVGALNGLFGGGGGMVVVPILTLIVGLEEKRAHATAIAIILPLCLLSGIIYVARGVFEWKTGLLTTIGVVLGGIVGAVLLKKLSNKFLTCFFYLLMIAAGIRMIF